MRLVSRSFNNAIKMLLPLEQGTHITVNEDDDFEVVNELPALTAGEAIFTATTSSTSISTAANATTYNATTATAPTATNST